MNNTWKLSILGAVALVASSAVVAIGCTVTTTNGPLGDGGIGDDSSTGDGGSEAAPPADGGTDGDAAVGCSATAACPIIGSSQGVTFDNPSCGNCDKCSATNCCAEITKCFQKVDGSKSDCESLFDCILACAAADGGDTCKAACRAGSSQQAYDDLVAADTCQTGNGDAGTGKCTAECM